MHDKAFTFQTLRPDTIIDGLFDLGMRVDSGLTPLNSYENRVYQFQDEERHRYVVKFYRPERWSAEQILEEHQFALQLVEDEVPVAAPLLFNDSTLHQHQGFYFAVFPSLGGRQFEADNLDQMEWVGRYLGRLHGDCHAGNILWRDGPLFVDLDDARTGPAIQDLWMLLNGDKAEQRMQLETIVEAYEEFSPFNSDEIALIEPLRAMRLVYYLAWLLRRWDDPAFPVNFPWLTGEDYWRGQTSTFLEQVKVLQEPPLQLTPMY
ncbi:serine/threonine protein kinase [Klebsiella pneumoniae]|uniref:serine/threonine protein kinase n=1 Tax=Klebsiella pneumoniae TaxID=573 RepID=UPI0001A5804D|nr:serine/threonine protein kinase [Klebsiella pneumoniae]QFY19816.1 serine/threonine protein kinase [Klebsiella pneumoniae]WEE49646.1 serine/threonine protein kinase [Klebsiella pneumoniae]SSJ91353.1 YihE protein [Klebsiella pneumoniae]BAH60941.1 conserved hypothetical protein [Klebsiella pneumoniae subsp. pneumoniae NTUH-K2044]HBT0023547.1 serine/threonine protein kinase [Klebsiella pneumoniae subsp. pneumoniae NTUH-K2044]